MTHPAPQHRHAHESTHTHTGHPQAKTTRRLSVLAWPAWRRMLIILPLVIALWLAVWWTNMGASPW